jgi:hypothetical protein
VGASGSLGVLAVRSPAEVPLEDGEIVPTAVAGSFTELGVVKVDTGGSVRGDGGLRIAGKSVTVRQFGNVLSGDSATVDVVATGAVEVSGEGSLIGTGSFDTRSGDVRVKGASVDVRDEGLIESLSDFGESGMVEVIATTGAVNVDAASIRSIGGDRGGLVRVAGASVAVAVTAAGAVNVSFASFISSGCGTGQGGPVELVAAAVDVNQGGLIVS